GKVTAAEDGRPIPGVNVVLKGTTQGTVTNHRGEYSLFIPGENGTLIFSFIGYVTKEVAIGTTSSVNVALNADVRALNEVVVTGQGAEEKEDESGTLGKPYRHK